MKIAVLMSTYNGEKYLKEQIESILSQKLNDDCKLTLFIRDDGSVDQTRDIIESYARQYENVTCVPYSSPIHKGIKDSFMFLLKTAEEKGYDYYAFSDQDDVWMENKLAVAVDSLESHVNPKGALYYSNRYVVDKKLRVREKQHIRFYGDFTEILWGSKAAGNTMIFNHILAEKILLCPTQMVVNHDTWVYRLAKCIGSDIYFDENAYIYYRQHANNVVGYSRDSHSWPHMIINVVPRLVKPREHIKQNHIREIFEYYYEDLDPKVTGMINQIMDYNKNSKSKWALLTNPDMKKRPVLERCIWVYNVLFNMI